MAKTPSQEVQNRALSLIKDTLSDYKNLNTAYMERMLRIYESFSTYEEQRRAEWSTTFKVNKAHEVIEKVLPRIIAKNPRWVVSPRTDDFNPTKDLPMDDGTPEAQLARAKEYQRRLEQAKEFSHGIQDYLSYIFEEYGLVNQTRLWAKNMLVYGKGRAKIKYKYETATILEDEEILPEPSVPETPQLPGQPPQPVVSKKKRKVEKVVGEYPTIDVKSWTDIYTDPRYLRVGDMPAYIENVNGVRLWDLKRNKDKYFNLDKLEEIAGLSSFNTDNAEYKRRVQAIAGIQNLTIDTAVDKNALHLTVYYGYFQEDDDMEEKMYKICVVENMLVISYEEITQIPFEEIDCFEDTETNHSVGFVEPIVGLQDELNFKKNSSSEYINHALNRSWLWSANSGVDPRDLISKPNNIIVTSKNAQEAMANLIEIPHRELNSSFFQEQNDFERQIQSMTFTVDTSNAQSQQALTNTATGIRIKFFESNSVIDEVRKHFEHGLERLAYKLLQTTFENMEDNIVIKKLGDDGFWEINKELLRDAITRYTIRVEVNSSSYTDLESRREDAIALFNSALSASQAGVPVDLQEIWKDVAYTFEKKDLGRYIKPPKMQDIAAELSGGAQGGQPQGGGQPLPPYPPQGLPPAAELTEQVAAGGLTSAVAV